MYAMPRIVSKTESGDVRMDIPLKRHKEMYKYRQIDICQSKSMRIKRKSGQRYRVEGRCDRQSS